MRAVLYGPAVVSFAERLRGAVTTPWTITAVANDGDSGASACAFAQADAVVAVSYGQGDPALGSGTALVQVPGAGCDGIDASALPPHTTLCNVYCHEVAVAEYVLLAVLEWSQRIGAADARFRAGDWSRSSRFGGRPVQEISGKSLCIVGLGRIGAEVARRAKAFGMRVEAVNRSPREHASVDEVHPWSGLPQALARADVVVLCCALTSETKGLIGEDALRAMKPSAVLVNVARGPVADEDALWSALSEGRIGGAVLDVWWNYPARLEAGGPPSRHPFTELPNVIVTPHLAGWSDGTIARRWASIGENLDRLAQGQPLNNVVRPASAQPF